MRRSTSRIGKLPGEVLEEVNEKLAASWEYRRVRKWLFEEVAGEDVPALGLVKGEKFGLVWLRAGKSTEHAWHHCELALGNWFRGWHQEWVKAKILRSEPMRAIKRAAALTREAAAAESGAGEPRSSRSQNRDGLHRDESAAGADSGGDILMRSVLIDAVATIQSGSKDPKEIAQLTNSWARLKETSQADEKLRLKTVEGVEAGLDALYAEVKDDAEAIEAFEKFRDIVRRKRKQRSADAEAMADESLHDSEAKDRSQEEEDGEALPASG